MFSPGLDGRIRNCCPEPKLRKSSYGTAPFTLINDFFSFWCTQSAFLILCFPVVKSKLVLWIQIRYLEIGSGSRSSTGLVPVFCEFMSKIWHLLALFYPIFTIKKIYMFGSESVFGIRIRIHEAPEYVSGSTTLQRWAFKTTKSANMPWFTWYPSPEASSVLYSVHTVQQYLSWKEGTEI